MLKEYVKIVYTREALQDLFQIGEYIETKLGNPRAGRRITAEISHSISLLQENSEMGRSLSAALPFESSYRFLVSGNYMVFYRFDGSVYVERILYGKRDYLHILFE